MKSSRAGNDLDASCWMLASRIPPYEQDCRETIKLVDYRATHYFFCPLFSAERATVSVVWPLSIECMRRDGPWSVCSLWRRQSHGWMHRFNAPEVHGQRVWCELRRDLESLPSTHSLACTENIHLMNEPLSQESIVHEMGSSCPDIGSVEYTNSQLFSWSYRTRMKSFLHLFDCGYLKEDSKNKLKLEAKIILNETFIVGYVNLQ